MVFRILAGISKTEAEKIEREIGLVKAYNDPQLGWCVVLVADLPEPHKSNITRIVLTKYESLKKGGESG